MTKEEILDYVLQTPENTNRMVLSDMLDEFSSGGGDGGLVVNATVGANALVLDKTWQEIHDTMAAGTNVVIVVPPEEEDEPTTVFPATECGFAGSSFAGGGYIVITHDFLTNNGYALYQCSAASDYPTHYFYIG